MSDTVQTLEMQVHRLKEENRRIKRENNLSRALINAMDFPVVMIDGTGTVLNFNRRAADRFNLRQEQGETVRIWEKLTASACSQWEKDAGFCRKERFSQAPAPAGPGESSGI